MARRFVLKPEKITAPKLTLDYAEELNPQQYAAATAGGGPILVIAGAGTGKTRTLIYRVAYLVETDTPPESIVLLTFTRRSAREMLTRAATLLDGRCQQVQGGTFHAFCLGILRRHAPRLGYPKNFSILDSTDAADVIDVLRTQMGLNKSSKRFPRKRTLYGMFSAVGNQGVPLQDILEERYPQFLGHQEALEELHQRFVAYKQTHGLMDYDDLLLRTLDLFQQDDGIRREVAAQCRHVLVDEYQDTNQPQARLVQQFASVHGNVMAVGDDAQSIYRFRGADFRNIFQFPQLFPQAEVLKLEHNYRSTQPILDLANHVIRHARQKYDKQLFSERNEGELPAIVPAPDDRYESRFVSQAVLQFREEGTPLNRMAVLFRSGFNSYDLELELGRSGIPFVKYGGLKLSEAAHIKDVVAHLKVADNPQDAIAWMRILQLIEGIGPKTAQKLIDWITSDRDDPYVIEDGPFSKRYIEGIKQLFTMLRSIRQPNVALAAQVEGVLQYYEPVMKRKYFEDYPKRQQDLDHFVGLADGFDTRADFLSSLALDPIELTALENDPLDDDEPPLILSTIHSAKGLEFHSVFVIHALDGVLPSSYSLKDADAIDEELRLLYVAITRAEENLFISYPMVQHRRFQGDYLANPSRFLADIPEALLEPMHLVEGSHAELPPAPPEPKALPAPPKALPEAKPEKPEPEDSTPKKASSKKTTPKKKGKRKLKKKLRPVKPRESPTQPKPSAAGTHSHAPLRDDIDPYADDGLPF